ncbi:MAG: hypothetical protein NT007_09010 [Candidatus Kapabacteria bacterium]|nr:hypothetical protein [Candidatus Kapabacteria bacterium]
MKIKFQFLILALGAAFLISATKINTESYYPLSVGSWWKYSIKSRMGQSSMTDSIISEYVNNQKRYFVFLQRNNEDTITSFYYYRSDEGKTIWELTQNDFVENKFLDFSMNFGDSIRVGKAYPNSNNKTLMIFQEDFKSIKIDGVHYSNVKKMLLKNYLKIQDRTDINVDTLYFAKGIGLIYARSPQAEIKLVDHFIK